MIELSSLADLGLNDEQIWVAIDSREISYPSDGNEACFEIEEDSFWFRHRNGIITSVISQFPPDGTIFDVGGGNGFVSLGLQRAELDAVLVEPGPRGAQNARRRGLENVVCSTLEDAGFRPESLPAVGLFDVLEHIDEADAFLKTIHASLIPEGHLYVTVPALRSLWSTDDVHAGHFRRYSTAMLTRDLTAAGFEVCFCSYFFWFLPIPLFLFRSLPSKFGLRKEPDRNVARKEHSRPSGIRSRILDWCLSREQRRIAAGKKMRTGTSCIAVARKR
jgi:SAM-dependent methyltransferase